MQERSVRQDLECDKISLERQVSGWSGSLGDRPEEMGKVTMEGEGSANSGGFLSLSEQGLEKPVGQL